MDKLSLARRGRVKPVFTKLGAYLPAQFVILRLWWMETSSIEQDLARERRARLSAERLLDQKQRELKAANKKLSEHALSLSGQIVDQRKVVQQLEGENTKVSQDLEKANDKVVAVERLLWDALETIKDGFALFDADFRLIAANGPYLRAVDGADFVTPGINFETILDHCIDEGIVDLEDTDEDAWFDMMVDRWSADRIEPITIRLWNGGYVKMMDRRTADGGIVSLALDITDTIRREAELLDARDRAQAADRAKSAFLAKMSHELRTPMNGVVGMADLLLDGEENEERHLYASTIRNSGEALLEIINDVLDFSKIEADKIDLKPRPFDLEQVIQEVALIVEPTVQQKGLNFCVDYDQFLPTGFVGDPGRIRQILTNLVGNAVKFTEEGHILVRVVGLTADNSATCQLHITVEDTGIGINSDQAEHVFGEFNQAEDESNRKYEGTGLGLAITRGLVEQMGGEVWLESAKGEGSCFGLSLTLPVSGDVPSVEMSSGSGVRKAVVIDPHQVEAKVLVRQLERLNVEATAFESFEAAADHMGRHEADLIFALPECETEPDAPPGIVWLGATPDHDPDGQMLPLPIFVGSLRDILGGSGADAIEPETPARDRPVVLAAEDNKTNQLVFRKMLKDLDLDLTIVGNGKEAVEAFKELRPDAIFMDISMPEMDGMEATRAIRSLETGGNFPRTPIIAMTAHAMDGDEERIREAGVDHYLTKPLKKDLIHQKLDDVLVEFENVLKAAV